MHEIWWWNSLISFLCDLYAEDLARTMRFDLSWGVCLPSGCGELQCQQYQYILLVLLPQSWYPWMAATGLSQTNECFRGLFMWLLRYLCCAVFKFNYRVVSRCYYLLFALRIETFVVYVHICYPMFIASWFSRFYFIVIRIWSRKRSSLLFQLLFSSRHSP